MSSKRNVVSVRIAYINDAPNRDAINPEISFLLELNDLLGQHKELSRHQDHVLPVVAYNNEAGTYGCNINLRFNTRPRDGKQFNHPRLHFLLVEIAELCNKHQSKFTRMERYLDLDDMAQPWVQVVGPAQVLLREGFGQYNATGPDIPARDGHQPINGMTVLGEPKAVEDFRKAWIHHVNRYIGGLRPDELHLLGKGDMDLGARLDMTFMRAEHPSIQWQHLQIWVHAVGGSWVVTNLDVKDKWLLAGVQYLNANHKNMMEVPLDYTACNWPTDTKFFKDLEYVSFEEHFDEVASEAA